MKRPFFVHVPRNRYGESLVRTDNGVGFSIRSALDSSPRPDIKLMGHDRLEADSEAKRMNDQHEAEMAAIFI